MVKIYRPCDFQQMPWKNGQGITTQLLNEPNSAVFSRDAFVWRLSSAPIKKSGTFSKFSGYRRLLVVTKGNGIIINEELRRQHEVISLSGDDESDVRLQDGPVEDLGLIYDPKKVEAEMSFVETTGGKKTEWKNFPNETYLFFCLRGPALINSSSIGENELACASSAGIVQLLGQKDSQWVVVLIRDTVH